MYGLLEYPFGTGEFFNILYLRISAIFRPPSSKAA